MREIKFRGLDLDGKWRYGFFKRGGAYCWIQNDSGGDEAVIDNTVGQFTGLKDKNGKEIYEGDIIGCETIHGIIPGWVIEWNQGHASFRPRDINRKKSSSVPTNKSFWSDHQIIGNIHQNTEML